MSAMCLGDNIRRIRAECEQIKEKPTQGDKTDARREALANIENGLGQLESLEDS
jgi:hypothetical protein